MQARQRKAQEKMSKQPLTRAYEDFKAYAEPAVLHGGSVETCCQQVLLVAVQLVDCAVVFRGADGEPGNGVKSDCATLWLLDNASCSASRPAKAVCVGAGLNCLQRLPR